MKSKGTHNDNKVEIQKRISNWTLNSPPKKRWQYTPKTQWHSDLDMSVLCKRMHNWSWFCCSIEIIDSTKLKAWFRKVRKKKSGLLFSQVCLVVPLCEGVEVVSVIIYWSIIYHLPCFSFFRKVKNRKDESR